jgi:enoyl-CoA hydratase/carnithine racemase
MSEVVLIEVQDGVAVLTLNRPERLNAWVPELQNRYFELLDECAGRDDVRVIVVTGAGRGFCAGADMGNLQALAATVSNGSGAAGDGGTGEQAMEHRNHALDSRPVRYPLSIPKPIVAAINGPCAGIGMVMALMCDVRFANADAKFTTAFARRGLVAEHGISWILPRLIGPARALELLLSSRVLLGAEAASLGLVNQAFDGNVLDETLNYARDLAAHCAPSSMAAMKRQVYLDLERSLADSVEEANRLMGESFTQPDFAEGVASFLEQRAPQFAPLSV